MSEPAPPFPEWVRDLDYGPIEAWMIMRFADMLERSFRARFCPQFSDLPQAVWDAMDPLPPELLPYQRELAGPAGTGGPAGHRIPTFIGDVVAPYEKRGGPFDEESLKRY